MTMKSTFRSVTRMAWLVSSTILFLCACQPEDTFQTPIPYADTPTHTPSVTVEPNTEPEVLPEPSLTPLPSLSVIEAQSIIQELLVSDPQCDLPCWWGIEPGLTTWSEGYQFLIQFANIDRMFESIGNYYEYDVLVDGEMVTRRQLRMLLELSNDDRVIVAFEGSNDGIDWIEVFITDNSIEDYHFHNLLEKYGTPDEVLLNFRGSLDGIAPFDIYLYYKDKGFLAEYNWNADITEEFIYGCPLPTSPWLWLWSEGNTWAEELLNRELTEPHIPFKYLEEATGMDPNAFYEVFTNNIEKACIETYASVWVPGE